MLTSLKRPELVKFNDIYDHENYVFVFLVGLGIEKLRTQITISCDRKRERREDINNLSHDIM